MHIAMGVHTYNNNRGVHQNTRSWHENSAYMMQTYYKSQDPEIMLDTSYIDLDKASAIMLSLPLM